MDFQPRDLITFHSCDMIRQLDEQEIKTVLGKGHHSPPLFQGVFVKFRGHRPNAVEEHDGSLFETGEAGQPEHFVNFVRPRVMEIIPGPVRSLAGDDAL